MKSNDSTDAELQALIDDLERGLGQRTKTLVFCVFLLLLTIGVAILVAVAIQ